MNKESLLNRLDRMEDYLRREDTFLAESLNTISPKKGSAWRQSLERKIFDRALAIPPAVFSILAIPFLGLRIKIEDQFREKEERGPVFYRHPRLDQNGNPFYVYKLRSMIPGSDRMPDNSGFASQFDPEEDPRATGVGRFMRKFHLDELPQVWQVLLGNKLAMVAPRAKSEQAIKKVKDKTRQKAPRDLNKWQEKRNQGPLGVFNLNAAISPNQKNDTIARHADIFQADHASPAFDLFTISLTAIRLLKRRLKTGAFI